MLATVAAAGTTEPCALAGPAGQAANPGDQHGTLIAGSRRLSPGAADRPGARLPSEAALAGRFGCSCDTIRDALAVMTAEGFLVKRRAVAVSGTAVMSTGR